MLAVAEKCPGWSPTDCEKVPHEPLTYYMHRCNPLALPQNDTSTKLTCKPQAVNGTFQCYLGQASQCRAFKEPS